MTRQQRRADERAGRIPTRQALQELSERADAAGCGLCGALFAEYLPYLICRASRGIFTVRCTSCCTPDVTPALVCTSGGGGGDPWSKSDRDWFAAHPTRRWRLRAIWPGELAATQFDEDKALLPDAEAEQRGAKIAVAVYQHTPGKRQRITVWMAAADPPESYTDAGITRLMPDLVDLVRKAAASSDSEMQNAMVERLKRRMEATASLIRGRP